MSHDLDPSSIDPALWRGLTQPRFSRRQMLRYAGAGAGTVGLAAFLAACGTKGVVSSSGSPGAKLPNAGVGTEAWWNKQTLHHNLVFDNWPAYIDVAHGTHPSIDAFTAKTGIKVDYREDNNDNNAFFATHLRPFLQGGKPTGLDIVVLTTTDPPLGFMMDLGWLIPLDHRKMTNFKKYASPSVTNASYDPGNKYTMAWQSGLTVLAYNTTYIPEEITSIQSLFDPKYKGKIGQFGIASELGCMGLLAIGKDPATSTPADWKAAAAKLMQAKPLVRSYYDQGYLGPLSKGDLWISQAWSGDVYQAIQNGATTLKMVIPQEGAMFWTDNMCMPLYAANPLDAMTYMDSVYDPEVQAVIEDYNAYICPVPAAQQIIAGQLHDPTLANSVTVFPTADQEKGFKSYYQWKSQEDLDTWNGTFEPIFQS